MAHLWLREDPEDNWLPAFLTQPAYELLETGPAEVDGGKRRDATVLVVRRDAAEEEWVLLARTEARVWVNGTPLVLGTRVLRERDEVLLRAGPAEAGPGRRFYFSAERRAAVEPFPGADDSARCARCKLPIGKGDPAVRCPNCGAWHHQSDELPCWTYHTTCSLCDQLTDLRAGYRWTPEEI